MPRGQLRARRALLMIALAIVSACQTTPAGSGTSSATASPPPTDAARPGSLAIYLTLSRGENLSSVVAPNGERVTLQSTEYAVVQVVPELTRTTLFDRAPSYSFATSYTYPITSTGRLFVVRASTDTYEKSIEERNPRTNAVVQRCKIVTNDSDRDFALIGNRVFFHTRIRTDLAGRYLSGGDLVYSELPCGGEPRLVLPAADPRVGNKLFAAGGQLYTSKYNTSSLELWRLDPDTGKVLGTESLRPDVIVLTELFEGDDGLYFAVQGEHKLAIVRLPPDGRNATAIVASVDTAGPVASVAIDASGGDVYFAYRDTAPHFYVVGRAGGRPRGLDLDPHLYSTLIYGGGQILQLP